MNDIQIRPSNAKLMINFLHQIFLQPYLADCKVQPHVDDNKHEEQVECTND